MLRYYWILGLVLLCVSCETVIQLEPTTSAMPISVSSIIVPSKVFATNRYDLTVDVIRANRIDAGIDNFEKIEDAMVHLLNTDGTALSELSYDIETGVYFTQKKVEEGLTYTLKIEHTDFKTITAQTSIPKAVELGATTPEFPTSTASDFFENTIIYQYDLEIEIKNDPAEQDNYYHLIAYNLVEELAFQAPNGQPRQFYYFVNIEEEEPIGIPAIVMNDNEHADFRGVFFTDETFNGQESANVSIPFRFSINVERQKLEGEVLIELRSISKDYYDYYLSAHQQMQLSNNPIGGDITPIHNNIQNGYGIFASYSTSSKKVRFRE